MTRFGLFLVAYLSLIVLPLNNDPTIAGPDTDPWRGFPENLLLDGWARWDSGWYQHIAEHGYMNIAVGPEGQNNVGFFPLYPLLIRALNAVLHDALLSGMVISNLSFLAAVLLFYQMARDRFGTELADRAALLLCVFPFSFYFSAVYSESVFFLLAVAAFFFAERKQWWAAGVFAMLSGTARIAGLALFPALLLLYLKKIDYDWGRIRANVLWLGLGALGPAIYALYLYAEFGDPFLFVRALRVPGWWLEGTMSLQVARQVIAQLFSVQNLMTGNYHLLFAMNILVGGMILLSVIPVFRRQGVAYGVFSLLLVAVGLGQWKGLGRYALAAFPVYIAWAVLLRNRLLFETMVVVSALLLAFLTILFAHWYWVT
jgi:hypothetical protein